MLILSQNILSILLMLPSCLKTVFFQDTHPEIPVIARPGVAGKGELVPVFFKAPPWSHFKGKRQRLFRSGYPKRRVELWRFQGPK
jgi:hypothetical protein